MKCDILSLIGNRWWSCFSKHWICTYKSGGITFASNTFGLLRPKSGFPPLVRENAKAPTKQSLQKEVRRKWKNLSFHKIWCKSKSDQAKGSFQSKRSLRVPLNFPNPESRGGRKNIQRGNRVTQSLCPRTWSKAVSKPCSNFDTLCSNVILCFSTQDTKFFAGCHRW